jgi:hypothetical protein
MQSRKTDEKYRSRLALKSTVRLLFKVDLGFVLAESLNVSLTLSH